jgi:EF-P beta-lysylation protein EpmB
MPSAPLWRQIQRNNFTDWKKLLSFLDFDSRAESNVLPHSKFPLNLPQRLAEKIEKGNWNDPILRQFIPTIQESQPTPLFVLDPVADGSFRPKPKLLHKYHGRALLLCTSACAMHCRYCFRQHFDYETRDKFFIEELAAIASDSSISEILLSGGDPLSLSDAQLQYLLDELEKIPHLKRIRFHTRFPIGIPERIDPHFIRLLASCKKQMIFVIHCNHPLEFDEEIFNHLKKIQQLGIPVLSQSVLLHKINDDVETLKTLFELLIDNGIIPYYLHQLDRVQGAAHFEVPEEKGKLLMHRLGMLLPGYALPKYVREIANQPKKSLIIYSP